MPLSTLVLTKLQPPAPRIRAVERDRLLRKLQPDTDTDLMLVCSPAGYGKTTLLAQWVQQIRKAGVGVVWIALDESDNQPAAFGAYLFTGFESQLGPDSGMNRILQGMLAKPEIDLQQYLPPFVNTILASGRPLALILDDYHLIHNPVIHQAVEYLLAHRPPNLNIAIGSRSNPPLPLARLRVRGRLREIRSSDLRFTHEETGQFLRDAMGLEVLAGLPESLSAQVEGWAAGLQLAALSLVGQKEPDFRSSPIGGGHRRLSEYLLEEVVNRLPEEVQSFLLYTSIPERLSAPLCDFMLTSDQSAQLLGWLEQANLFLTPLDETGTWFRYHPLFREFLLSWLSRTQPEKASALHQSASTWFAEKGMLREGARHALLSNDRTFAVEYVERNSFSLIIRSEIATIHEWCSAFPETVMQSRPMLCIFEALALAYSFSGKHRPRVEARLEQAQQLLKDTKFKECAEEANTLSAVVRTFLAMVPDPNADIQKTLLVAADYLARTPVNDPGRFPWLLITGYCLLALHRVDDAEKALRQSLPLALGSGLLFGMVEATFFLARLSHSRGQLEEEIRLCREEQTILTGLLRDSALDLPAVGSLDIAIGDALLEQNNIEEAERYLRLGMEKMGWSMHPYYLMTGFLAQYRLYLAKGNCDNALACLDQLELLWPDIRFLTGGLRCAGILKSDPGERSNQVAREWLDGYCRDGEALPTPGLGSVGAAEAYYQANLAWVKIQIEIGDPGKALPWLDKQIILEMGQLIHGREIELRLLQAQAYHRLGQVERAIDTLIQVVTTAQDRGYLRIFDQGAVLDELIHTAVQQPAHLVYLDKIIDMIRETRGRQTRDESQSTSRLGRTMESPSVSGRIIEPLSDRELDVLRMIAMGASNQDIADSLVITVGTVKSHINHILSKLGAVNRTKATAIAREYGLIE